MVAAKDQPCPNCGTPRASFVNLPARAVSEDSRRRADIEANRAKLDAARGALQKCPACDYITREKDKLVPAAA